MRNILIHNFNNLTFKWLLKSAGGWLFLPVILSAVLLGLSACNNTNFPNLENTPRLPADWEDSADDENRPNIIIDN